MPLLKAAWSLWPESEAEANEQLLEPTGGIYIGARGSDVLEGSMLSARTHDLDHELLDAAESRRRFPALTIDDEMRTLYEPLAGILFPQRCIGAHLTLAERHGAELHFEERVSGWTLPSDESNGVTVTTDRGTYTANKLVVSVGAWLPKLVPELRLPLIVERNPLFWFEPVARPEIFAADRLPVWIMELDADHAFYGFPALPGQGVKVARHHGGGPVDPDAIDRVANDTDEAKVRGFIRRFMPLADGPCLDSRVCMYTNTPDFNFIVGLDPRDPRVVLASPCSGHGFKFSNVIGVICADLALTGSTSFEISFLSPGRFSGASA